MPDNSRVRPSKLPVRALARLISAALVCVACARQQPPPASQFTIFAAASLRESFTQLARAFEAANAGVTIALSFGGSQALAEQIAQGAPAGVFASANEKTMTAVTGGGKIDAADVRVFARNRLVCIVSARSAHRLTTLADLARPGVKLVLADAHVPAGQYALAFLAKASTTAEFGATYSQTVRANVVSYEEDVRAVYGKVALGEADAGIVYATDAIAGNAGDVARIDIPDALNAPAIYSIAALRDAPAPARAFVDFVLSPPGQAVLAAHGLLPADAR
jgi:molybdate transport system substrate-binding protein